jgi:DNA polymerase-3 subunit gamma/tau
VPEVGSEPAGSATAEKAWADEDVDEPDDDGDADGWDLEPNRVPSAHSRTVADQPDGPGRTATANRPQTADRAEAADRHEATARPAAASLADGSRKGSGRPAPLARAAEPAGVLPDAPEEPGAAVPAAPGQLSAAAIREVWPEIVATVGRQSKKVAALASGATVRELDGETLVLTFRFPAHAKMVAADPDLIVNALYEAVGGRWQIRCEVAGEAGGVLAQGGSAASPPARGAPVQKAPAQKAAARPAASAPARQREVVTPAASTSGDDDWPEPARPGGLAGPELSDEAIVESSDSAGVDDAGPAVADEGAARPAPPEGSGTANGGRSSGLAAARAAASGARNTVAARQGVPTPSAAVPNAEADSAEAGAGPPQSVRTETGRPKTASSESVRSAQPARSAAGRPEVAQSDAARVGVAPSDGGRTGATRPGAARSEAWSDGSAAEEPPYDPEYDGPPRGGAVAYEGFDPGDEPLDDVIDEKTARQSSEQQAMQLLHDAFGAEKIGEV